MTEEQRQEILGAICDSYLRLPDAPPGVEPPRFAFPYELFEPPTETPIRSLIQRVALNESARAFLTFVLDELAGAGATFDMLNCGLTRAGAPIERRHLSYFQAAGQA